MQTENINTYLSNLSSRNETPEAHKKYLIKLKNEGVNPNVIYDIGACVLHWTNTAKEIWPDAEYIVFDAFEYSELLFINSGHKYHIGVLSDVDDREVKFYENEYLPCGNSYYKEYNDRVFPPNKYRMCKTRSLDSIVKEKGFPSPDLVKIDVQGAERDVLMGAMNTLKYTSNLIVEMQHENYNMGAPLVSETQPYIESLGWKCVTPLFCNNGPDGDYHFTR